MTKTIYFAGGCFWGTEHYIGLFEGVIETVTGYANGNIPNPSYEQVYTDTTGYAECVKVVFDPEIISLETLCRLFFKSIDPLMKNRQGNDVGTRYRTGIYWTDGCDRQVIETVYDEIQSAYNTSLAVEKGALECFHPAEEYHQEYLIKNPGGYCHLSMSTLAAARKYTAVLKELRICSDDAKKEILPKFFKTGKGQYGEGDKFIGVTVPKTRRIAKANADLSMEVVEMLLESEWHEARLCALLILLEKYKKNPETIVRFYLDHTRWINNWDLIDLSAPYILGSYLVERNDRRILYELSASTSIWEQRIAVVSTMMLIRNNQFKDTLQLAEKMLITKHDLIQKAIGWMLREVGKRDQRPLMDFLEKNKNIMPRTMLRYAIEKFSPEQRAYYMKARRK